MIEIVCKNCGDVKNIYPSRLKNGRGVFCSNYCKWENNQKIMKGNDYWKKTIKTQFKKGHDNFVSPWSKKYHSVLYKQWREKILKKFKYKCVKCNSEKNLVVHHIQTRKEKPELIIDIKNGMVLCRKCHAKLHKTK